MSLPGTADLVAAYRFSDHDFDAWIASRDTATKRDFNCSSEELGGAHGSCWCKTSVPAGDICIARAALDLLPSLHSQPAAIGDFMRRQGAYGGIRSSTRSLKAQDPSPRPFRYPLRDDGSDDSEEFHSFKEECPEVLCLIFKSCAERPDDDPDDDNPDAPPEAPEAPSTPPPSRKPYKCDRDKPPVSWGKTCKDFNISNPRGRGSAFKYMLKQGCVLPKSCTTTSMNNWFGSNGGLIPLNAKFKVCTVKHLKTMLMKSGVGPIIVIIIV